MTLSDRKKKVSRAREVIRHHFPGKWHDITSQVISPQEQPERSENFRT